MNLSRDADAPVRRIILFTRFPEPGKTKTRLIPELGPDGAATLHRRLTEHALAQAQHQNIADVETAWTGGDEASMRIWLGQNARLREQTNGDLGTRMASALRAAFDEGATQALVAGCDCPDLGLETYEAAFDALNTHDLVLGPAVDGGYYLIGLRASSAHALPALMAEMEWSTNRVLADTITRAQRIGLRTAQVAMLHDVDLPEDLPVWERLAGDKSRPALSVVVCALNDATRIAGTLDALGHGTDMEIIVADGGSADGTRAFAKEHGALVVDAPRGRAAQFNRGAATAAGEVLLFLHADTKVPPTFRTEIQECLARPNTVAGAFPFATDYDSPFMRVVTVSTNLRARYAQLPYGDQGLFLRREIFLRAGGFAPVPLMEDYMLVRRVRHFGRIEIAASSAITSGDRWRRLGVWRTTMRNARIVALHEMGVPAERLRELYRRD